MIPFKSPPSLSWSDPIPSALVSGFRHESRTEARKACCPPTALLLSQGPSAERWHLLSRTHEKNISPWEVSKLLYALIRKLRSLPSSSLWGSCLGTDLLEPSHSYALTWGQPFTLISTPLLVPSNLTSWLNHGRSKLSADVEWELQRRN